MQKHGAGGRDRVAEPQPGTGQCIDPAQDMWEGVMRLDLFREVTTN